MEVFWGIFLVAYLTGFVAVTAWVVWAFYQLGNHGIDMLKNYFKKS